jgi:hypothetical protein
MRIARVQDTESFQRIFSLAGVGRQRPHTFLFRSAWGQRWGSDGRLIRAAARSVSSRGFR